MKSLYYKRLCGHKNPSEKNSRFVSITFGVIQANMTTRFDNFGIKLLKFAQIFQKENLHHRCWTGFVNTLPYL